MARNTNKTAPNEPRQIAALIVAAGSGSRMSMTDGDIADNNSVSDVPKQFRQLGNAPVLAYSINAFATHPNVLSIVVVTAGDYISKATEIVTALSKNRTNQAPITIVKGGATRQQSVRAGLHALQNCDARLVAIHDAARPLLTHDIIDRLAQTIRGDVSAALPVLPIADTIKTTATNMITGTIDRSNAAAAQTPQMFILDDIRKLHDRHAADTDFTDDISMTEAAGTQIAAVAGSQHLMKITHEADLVMVRALLAQRDDTASPQNESEQPMIGDQTMPDMRVGNGYDVHKFSDSPGPIMLCGVSVPSDRGMSAHSDGDVGLHALCDAIFGALADGDIGYHFPPSDPQWKDADSAQFLAYAMQRCSERDAQVTSLDLTLICEYPKITPLRDDMRHRIAAITGLAVERIGVKATTSEGLGFTGRREGIAAQATATLYFPVNNQ